MHDPAAAAPVLDFVARTHLNDVVINPLVAQLQTTHAAAAPVQAQAATSAPTRNGP